MPTKKRAVTPSKNAVADCVKGSHGEQVLYYVSTASLLLGLIAMLFFV